MTSNLEGVSDDLQYVRSHQPVASAHDRGHVCPQVRREDATQLPSPGREPFARFLGRSLDTVTAEDLRRYQVYQTEAGMQAPSMNSSAVALRFFFTVTLGRANLAAQLTRVHYPRRLPRVLSPEEVGRLIEAATGLGLKYKAALSVAYDAGLRASEVMALKVADIDSKRLLIPGRAGQGPQGPACDALATAARRAARVVAAVPVAGLAVPRALPVSAHPDTAAQPCLSHGR
jgi:integrase